MSWLSKLMPSRIRTEGGNKRGVPEGLWSKCDSCAAVLYRPEMERNLEVCPKCGHHHAIGARQRLSLFLDEGSAIEIAPNLEPNDALRFRDQKKYKDRIIAAQKHRKDDRRDQRQEGDDGKQIVHGSSLSLRRAGSSR